MPLTLIKSTEWIDNFLKLYFEKKISNNYMPRVKYDKYIFPVETCIKNEETRTVPQFNFSRHSHTTSTSNFNPKVSLGNVPVMLHQMDSSLPIMSAQVRHAFSNNPLYER